MFKVGSSVIGGLIFAVVGCCLGVVFIAISSGDLLDYYGSRNWHEAQGEVISSHIDVSTSSDDSDTYRPVVTYFYYAGDVRYTNDRLNFGDSIYTSSQGNVQDKVNEYAPGTEIRVLYNPDDPQDSVIERRLGGGLVAFSIAGICALVLGILGGAFAILRGIL